MWKLNTHILHFCLKTMYVLEYISTYSHSRNKVRIPIKLLSGVTYGEWERKGRLDFLVKKCSCVLMAFSFNL